MAKQPLSLKAAAVRLLARREYSRAELHARLIARGATRDDVERVLDQLEQSGYLSDARFAQALIAQKAGRYGKRAIAHQLRQKQVAPAAADEALASMAVTDEIADATALWQRRFGVPPKDEREKARQVRFLQARGYTITIALKVLRSAGVRDDTAA
ncbi:MAG TPA: recombination regulator RecX [Casimicrobiaceae bacterium]